MKEQFLFASLAGHQYIALTTYRKNGTPNEPALGTSPQGV